jgi:SAM-dependent methyltransferase
MLPIREIWKQNRTDKNAGVQWWDSMAEDFSKFEIPTAKNSLTMRIIEREKMLSDNCSALDVGCGSGRFSVALALQGIKVTGIDISPKMINFARAAGEGLSGLDYYLEDWHLLALDEKKWEKGFDLVFANMTPAVTSADTFMKLTEASKKWCLLVKPSRRTNSVLDALNEIAGAQRDTKSLDETIAYAFDLLWQEGYCPKLEYEPQVWQSKKPLEEAVFQYTKRIETHHDLSEGKKEAIREFLTSSSVNGFVEESTKTTIVAMYWQV